ncbi:MULTISPECIES: hypothetical protein [Serratia]|nr:MULTISPECIES: hypothetical protein [Serratia]MDR8536425.1 hypothetical protein [Serratia nevei]
MNTRANSRRKTGLTIKYRTQLDTASKAVTLVTFTSTVYGSMLLFFFSIKHNINFIDLISPGILISAGTLALFMLTMISALIIAILYVNKESIQNSFLCLIYITPYKKAHKHKKTIMAFFNLLICMWPFILIKTSSVNTVLIYLIVIECIALTLSIATSHICSFSKVINNPPIKIRTTSIKAATLFVRALLFVIIPLIELIIILSLILFLSFLFKSELTSIDDGTFAITVAVAHFLLKLPSLSTSKRSRNLSTLFFAAIIIAETAMLLSFTFSQNLAQAASNRIGITLDNSCFLRNEVLKNGIARTYINESESNNDLVKLNLVTKVNDIYYLSIEPGNEIERKANIRIKGLNLTELDCPRKKE